MAKKADLLAEAKKLKLDVKESNTIAEIEAAIENSKGGADNGINQEVYSDSDKAVGQGEEVGLSSKQGVESSKGAAAKAGKRSAKAIAEAEEKQAKEERKAHAAEAQEAEKPKHVQKSRTRLERAGKKLREASKLVEKDKDYSTKEALELAVKTSTTKFDATVELHVRLNVDPKQADQNIREVIVLPAGTGRSVRVAVFGEPDDAAAGKKAGADVAGSDEFLQQLEKGVIDFDVLIATPTVMAKLGKYARVLGPKGLMPNPKSGTVTKDVAKAVEQAKAGKVELRVDETGIVHLGIGKVSFGTDKLLDNAQAVFTSLKSAKPSGIKGSYVTSIYTTTSMGPSIKIAASEI
jgi:large subunit ribosomal protein L1